MEKRRDRIRDTPVTDYLSKGGAAQQRTNLFAKVFEVGMIGPVLAFMTRHGAPLNTIVIQLKQRTTFVRATEAWLSSG
jgi:hypothetical protein